MNLALKILLSFLIISQTYSYNFSLDELTTSGISSGSYMASQLSISYSSNFIGSIQAAGGPYLCSEGMALRAISACMNQPYSIMMHTLYDLADSQAKSGYIDDLKNVARQKVFLYSGTKDTVVHQGVMKKAEEWYKHYNATIQTKYDIPSEHAWITTNSKYKCTHLGIPYINNCDYNLAYEGLNYLLGNVKSGAEQNPMNLLQFDQKPYQNLYNLLDNKGYIYVPKTCQDGNKCKLHIAFGGCKMTLESIGLDFVRNSQWNELAETNNLIILYPQVTKSDLAPYNPEGCWDWWGYTEYTPMDLFWGTKKSQQISAIWNMVNDLKEKKLQTKAFE